VSVTPLERAIALIKQGKRVEAQEILKPLIAADHHNLPAWFWFTETCSTNKQRLNVLEICLEYNPDNEQVKQALDKIRTLPMQLSSQPLSNGKTEDTSRAYLFLTGLSITSGLLIASTQWIYGLAYPVSYWKIAAITLIVFLLLLLLATEWLLYTPKKFIYWFSALSKLFSVISGLFLTGIILIVYLLWQNDISTWELGGLIFMAPLMFLVYVVPWLLIVPIASAVYKITPFLSGKAIFDNIHPFSLGVPVIFNILGAAAFIITPFASDIRNDITVTVKKETFRGTQYGDATYEVVLNVKNLSQKEISDADFYLVTYKSKNDRYVSDFLKNNFLGSERDRNIIPIGESDIVIDVSIDVNENYSECKDGSLEKPLYLMYAMGDTFKPLAVSDSINKKILETLCSSTP
jgi:hypothetical protein